MTAALDKMKLLERRVAQLQAQLAQMASQQRNAEKKAAQMEAENADDVANGKPPRHTQSAIQAVRNSAPSANQIGLVQNQLADAERDLAQMRGEYEQEKEEGQRPTTRTVIPSIDVPDASAGGSYEEVKAAMRQNLMAELSRLNNQIFTSQAGLGAGKYGQKPTYSINQQQRRRLRELSQKLQNFDSYFDNVWRTEIAPQIKSKIPTPSYPGIPEGAAPMIVGMASPATQEQALLPQIQNSRFRPQLGGMAQKKPPIASIPQQTTRQTSMNQVDENGIPMIKTGAGWVKDRRFYKPDGTLFGMM